LDITVFCNLRQQAVQFFFAQYHSQCGENLDVLSATPGKWVAHDLDAG
jgi:hypothetical protein